MIMRIKVPYVISMSIIIVAAIFMGIGLYLAFIPVKVISANVQPYKVLTPVVKAGGVVIYQVDACKYREVPSLVTRAFIDQNNIRYVLPPQANNVTAGCTKTGIPVATSSTFHAGKWYLSLDVAYRVNPLRTESYHFRTEIFTITN